jgi:prolyl-tRNA editing enzyme YbaK/EbsC (Cys-tRNA(Pro) deacylase)
MHPSAENVAALLRERGVAGSVVELPDPAPTAAAAAALLGGEVGAIANSLVFAADGDPLLVLTSGAHRVDTVQVGELVDAQNVTRRQPRVRTEGDRAT